MGSFAEGMAERGDYWRAEDKKDQAALAAAATTLNNFIRQNPQATKADIDAFAKKLNPGGADAILGKGGLDRADQNNQDILNQKEEDRAYTLRQRGNTQTTFENQQKTFSNAQSVYRRNYLQDLVTEDRNRKNFEIKQKTDAITLNKNKNDLFTKALDQELAAISFGQKPLDEAAHKAAGQRALQKLTAIHPELDFTEITKQFNYLTRKQKRDQNRAKKQQEAANIVRQEVEAKPQAYSGKDSPALAQLRNDIRVKFGFDEDVQLVTDQEVAQLIMDGVKADAVANYEQQTKALTGVYDQIGERALVAKNDNELTQQAVEVLSRQFPNEPEIVEQWMAGFDPSKARDMAESKILHARGADMRAIAGEVDTVPAMIEALGLGHLTLGHEFKARLKGFLDQKAPTREQANREYLSTAMQQELSNPTRILRDLYDGNAGTIDKWLTALNKSANKNYTLDDVETLLRKNVGDGIRATLANTVEAETTITPGADNFVKKEGLDNMLGLIAGRHFNIGSDGKNKGDNGLSIVDILIQNGSIKTKGQLNAAIEIVKARKDELSGEGVNLLSASSTVANILKQHPATTSLDPKQSARWNMYRSAMRLLDDPDGFISQYEKVQADGSSLSNGYAILNQLEESGAEMTHEDRVKRIAQLDQYLHNQYTKLEMDSARLDKYGPALRKDEYDRYKSAIEQGRQALAVFQEKIRAVDERPTTTSNTQGGTTTPIPQEGSTLSDQDFERIAGEIEEVINSQGKIRKTSDGISPVWGGVANWPPNMRKQMVLAYAKKYNMEPRKFAQRLKLTTEWSEPKFGAFNIPLGKTSVGGLD